MGEQKIEIDGETYWLQRLRPMDASRFLVRALKLLGPAARALALSVDGRGFLRELLGSDAPISGLLGPQSAEQLPVLLAVVGDMSEELDEDRLVALIELSLIGKLAGKKAGERVALDDLATYESVLGDAMAKHGITHQMKLLWSALRLNLGPTFGGGGTNSPATSKTQE